jgi:hypothetical protein
MAPINLPSRGDSSFLHFLKRYHQAVLWGLLIVAIGLMIAFIPLTVGSLFAIIVGG